MKEMSIKAFNAVFNSFFSCWEKVCDMSPTDTWWQQLCIFIVLITLAISFVVGSIYLSIWGMKETGLIVGKKSHRPHITRTVEPQKTEVRDGS